MRAGGVGARTRPSGPGTGTTSLALVALALAGTSPGKAQVGPASVTIVAATERFVFHSDPWVNLHHFLYQWSRADRGLGGGRQEVSVPERAAVETLPSPQRTEWERALAFYRDSVASRSHFDREMLDLKRMLLALEGKRDATPPDVIPGSARALQIAMPIYRTRWWPDHDRANRFWIASVTGPLRRHEARYLELTTRIYGADWSGEPFRVDVSVYANPRAGYTAQDHIVIYSTDPGNQDLYGVETLLHEVQHTRRIGAMARTELAGTFERADLEEPPNLWHGIIFATAGEFVRTIAERDGRPEHRPYWLRDGFDDLRGWRPVVAAVREHWLPVVRGAASREAGFTALVRALRREPRRRRRAPSPAGRSVRSPSPEDPTAIEPGWLSRA